MERKDIYSRYIGRGPKYFVCIVGMGLGTVINKGPPKIAIKVLIEIRI